MSTVTLEVGGLFEELDHLGVEKQLRQEPGVRRAVANPASGSVTVDFDPGATSVNRLQWIIDSCGFRCRGEVTPRHVCTPDPAPARAAHEGHSASPARDQMADEMGHGAGMDMAVMVRDMRNRFWIALAFTVPLFIYSPMGGMFSTLR